MNEKNGLVCTFVYLINCCLFVFVICAIFLLKKKVYVR
jgi:hypothetical protein